MPRPPCGPRQAGVTLPASAAKTIRVYGGPSMAPFQPPFELRGQCAVYSPRNEYRISSKPKPAHHQIACYPPPNHDFRTLFAQPGGSRRNARRLYWEKGTKPTATGALITMKKVFLRSVLAQGYARERYDKSSDTLMGSSNAFV